MSLTSSGQWYSVSNQHQFFFSGAKRMLYWTRKEREDTKRKELITKSGNNLLIKNF